MIFHEGFVFRKQWAPVRIFDICLQGYESFFARLLQQFIHHLQSVYIPLLAVLTGPKRSQQAAYHLLHGVNRIGDQHGAERGAADDDQLRRLHEHLNWAVLHEVAGQDAPENNYDSNDRKHETSSSQAYGFIGAARCSRLRRSTGVQRFHFFEKRLQVAAGSGHSARYLGLNEKMVTPPQDFRLA